MQLPLVQLPKLIIHHSSGTTRALRIATDHFQMDWLNIPFIERQGSERTMSKPIRSPQQQILVASGQVEEKLKG